MYDQTVLVQWSFSVLRNSSKSVIKAGVETIVNNDKYILLGKSNSIYQGGNSEEIFSLKLTESNVFPLFEEVIKHEGALHPVYRFTGVMLNYAEALYRLEKFDEMRKVINQVRASLNKVELTSFSSNDATLTEITTLWREIINKDYGYFALLKQLNLAVSTLDIKEYETLYPIPMDELYQNSQMDHNPGYL